MGDCLGWESLNAPSPPSCWDESLWLHVEPADELECKSFYCTLLHFKCALGNSFIRGEHVYTSGIVLTADVTFPGFYTIADGDRTCGYSQIHGAFPLKREPFSKPSLLTFRKIGFMTPINCGTAWRRPFSWNIHLLGYSLCQSQDRGDRKQKKKKSSERLLQWKMHQINSDK